MNLNTTIKPKCLALVLIAAAFMAFPAWAQWQWLDGYGHKVFSDRSPPPEIAEKDILQRPSTSTRIILEPDAAAATAPKSNGVKPVAKSSDKDTELLAKKKQAQAQEAEAKKAEEEKNTKARISNCERAKTSLMTLQSGIRIATVNAKGEREFLDETKLAQETKRVQETIESNCK